MTLRKMTIDNTVRYIPKSEQTKEIKQNKMEKKVENINPFLEEAKPNKKFSKNNKEFIKNVVASGFAVLK